MSSVWQNITSVREKRFRKKLSRVNNFFAQNHQIVRSAWIACSCEVISYCTTAVVYTANLYLQQCTPIPIITNLIRPVERKSAVSWRSAVETKRHHVTNRRLWPRTFCILASFIFSKAIFIFSDLILSSLSSCNTRYLLQHSTRNSFAQNTKLHTHPQKLHVFSRAKDMYGRRRLTQYILQNFFNFTTKEFSEFFITFPDPYFKWNN